MEYAEITSAVAAALSRRDERRDLLAARIRELAEPALEAARKRRVELGEAGTLEYRRPSADCSQWANRVDCPDRVGEPVLMLVVDEGDPGAPCYTARSLGEPPSLSFWDGSNMQHQRGPTRDHLTGRTLRPATVAQLRAVAAVLPAALATLLADARASAESQAAEADQARAAL